MIRKVCISLAVVALVASVSSSAFAGGGSNGGTKNSNATVYVKNVGTAEGAGPIGATVVAGTVPSDASPKVIQRGGVATFKVKPSNGLTVAQALALADGTYENPYARAFAAKGGQTWYVLAANDGVTSPPTLTFTTKSKF